ncbi:MAG: class I mannose-6-phosphate isomerase [Simkaniaceae bacterium]|nr:class I mannose-6-phosphate isomerase [Simkaniaceae bacterium]
MDAYPIKLKPAYKHYLWGGNRLSSIYGRQVDTCAESWEISDREDGMCVVENGSYAGRSLHDLVQEFSVDLVGEECSQFPVLIKVIDAARSLSVQVHPDEKTARELGSEPKTEMWIVLDADEGAALYVGLHSGITKESFETTLNANEVELILNRLSVEPGDVYFIPAGTIHAIGKGCMIFEVQQNSNTTYRVWDWGRLDADGKPRELHRKEALQSVDVDSHPEKVALKEIGEGRELIVENPRFVVEKWTILEKPLSVKPENSYVTLFIQKGECRVTLNEAVDLKLGQSVLIPACAGEFTIEGTATLLVTKRGR